jgi:hypothetical protein
MRKPLLYPLSHGAQTRVRVEETWKHSFPLCMRVSACPAVSEPAVPSLQRCSGNERIRNTSAGAELAQRRDLRGRYPAKHYAPPGPKASGGPASSHLPCDLQRDVEDDGGPVPGIPESDRRDRGPSLAALNASLYPAVVA